MAIISYYLLSKQENEYTLRSAAVISLIHSNYSPQSVLIAVYCFLEVQCVVLLSCDYTDFKSRSVSFRQVSPIIGFANLTGDHVSDIDSLVSSYTESNKAFLSQSESVTEG